MLTTMHNLGKWDELADSLRDELAEYGGLLSLLDEQRDAIAGRDVNALQEANDRVLEQAASAQHYKDVREEVCARLARSAGQDPNVTVRELLTYMPAEARAMFEALVDEGLGVARSAQKKSTRNTVLLSHAGDLNEKLLMAMRPRSTTKTYNKRGGVYLRTDRSVGGLDLSA
jgi:flagellar biosynthesis/type III secretory pathway chaperone